MRNKLINEGEVIGIIPGIVNVQQIVAKIILLPREETENKGIKYVCSSLG